VLLCTASVKAQPVNYVANKPVAFVLAGDSTTATKGGWGDGFISLLQKPNVGTNHGKNGRTTVSFKSGGFWNNVIADVKKYSGQYQVYVTIQVSLTFSDTKSVRLNWDGSLAITTKSQRRTFHFSSIKKIWRQWQRKSKDWVRFQVW
jgi:hypothetical protein